MGRMKILKILNDGRVISAFVSIIGAIISACFAGCRLSFSEMAFKDFEAEIFNSYNIHTNSVEVR